MATGVYPVSECGGGQLARYFVSASYVDEGGMYKTDKTLDKYDTNANYHRFNYRMNVDMNLTKTTLLKVGISGSGEDVGVELVLEHI